MNAMRSFQGVLAAGAVVAAVLAFPTDAERVMDSGVTTPVAAAARPVLLFDAEPIVVTAARPAPASRAVPIGSGVLYFEAPTVYVRSCDGGAQPPKCS